MVKAADLKAGQKIEFVVGPITRGGIRKYGKASKDENGIHMFDNVGVISKLGGVIAHGMLSYGTTIADLDNWLENSGKITAINCEMRGMVRPGDCIFTTFTVKEIKGTTITFDWEQFAKCPLTITKGGNVITLEAEQRGWVAEKDKSLIKEEELKGSLKWLKTVWDEQGFPEGKYTESVEEHKDGGKLKFLWRLSLKGSAEVILNA